MNTNERSANHRLQRIPTDRDLNDLKAQMLTYLRLTRLKVW